MSSSQFFCGTSGLVLPVPNKQAFPAEFRTGTRLTYYASLFNSLEVNSSFYKIPRAATFAKWTTEVPADFNFTVKLWRGITHVPSLAFSPTDVEKFMETAAGIGPKKGCLLIQFPASLKANQSAQLEHLLTFIRQAEEQLQAATNPPVMASPAIAQTSARTRWQLAVEFRDNSWYTPATDRLLERFNATRVLQDMPASVIWEPMPQTSTIYMRYHGTAGDYKGSYTEERLKQDASRIKAWLRENKDVYVYFNNTIGDAIANAQFLVSQP
jgi:uncharacterized protein YecE (DUF72 family)